MKFCEDCKYYAKNAESLYSNCSTFYEGNGKQLYYSDDGCLHRVVIKTIRKATPTYMSTRTTVFVDNPFTLNKDNGCKYYKHKWWKFWIKER